MTERFDRKWDLTRRLYDLGLKKQEIWELYRLIDWLMRLPEELEQAFKQRMFDYERSKAMPYVTSIERMAMKEGWQKGQQEGAPGRPNPQPAIGGIAGFGGPVRRHSGFLAGGAPTNPGRRHFGQLFAASGHLPGYRIFQAAGGRPEASRTGAW